MPLKPEDQLAIVAAHNAYRRDPAIHAPDVAWSDELAKGAQDWADNLATNVHTLQHSVAGTSKPANTGENIAAAGRLPGSLPSNPAQMVDQWGKTPGTDNNGNPAPSEQQNFKPGTFPDISKTGDWHAAGHYSQVIWGDTTSVGCGFATDSTPDANGFIWDYLVGRYSPAGNVTGVPVPKPLPFKDQDKITLLASNGRYVTHLTSSDPNWNPIAASVQWAAAPTEARAQFTVTILPNNQIALKADNGLFAQRVDRRSDYQPIEAYGSSPNIYNQFTVTVLPNNQIALKADNNYYLSHVERDQPSLEACKSSLDAMCQFTVAMAPSNA